MVLAGLVFSLGRGLLKTLIFPIAFMFFMVPLPAIVVNAVAFPLQLFAARTAEFCCSISEFLFSRRQRHCACGHDIEVAEACSGIRFFKPSWR